MRDAIALERIKEACALVRAGSQQGTGYLLRADRLVTCFHVVEEALEGALLAATFEHRLADGSTSAIKVGGIIEAYGKKDDWAVVKLDHAIAGARPLLTAKQLRPEAPWLSFGFPSAPLGEPISHGLSVGGTVRDPSLRVQNDTRMIQLFSVDAAVAAGPDLRGFSGAPVLVGGLVVGHLCQILPDETGRAGMGQLFACPASRYASALPEQDISRVPLADEVGYDPLWYIHHDQLEKTALNSLGGNRAPVFIVAPEHFGKAALLGYLLDCVQREAAQTSKEYEIIYLNLRKLGSEERVSSAALITWFVEQCCQQLGLNPPVKRSKVQIGPRTRFRDFLRDQILKRPATRILFILDMANIIEDRACSDDLYETLRSIAVDDNYAKLRWLLTLSSDPAALQGPNASPFFNLSVPLVLGPLDQSQVEELAEKYGLLRSDPGLALLRDLIGGHPGLVRWALFASRQSETALIDLIQQARENPDGGVFEQPLRRLFFSLRDEDLVKPLAAVIHDSQHDLSPKQYAVLYRKGLLRMTRGGHYAISSPLFAAYFGRKVQ